MRLASFRCHIFCGVFLFILRIINLLCQLIIKTKFATFETYITQICSPTVIFSERNRIAEGNISQTAEQVKAGREGDGTHAVLLRGQCPSSEWSCREEDPGPTGSSADHDDSRPAKVARGGQHPPVALCHQGSRRGPQNHPLRSCLDHANRTVHRNENAALAPGMPFFWM